MLYVEQPDHIEILIPPVYPHVFRHGDPAAGTVRDLDSSALWELKGPASSGKPLLSLLSPKYFLCLPQSRFEAVPANARNRYRIPKPDRITGYRLVEVDDRIFGTTDPSVAVERPVSLYAATCFSYLDVPAGGVTLTGSTGGFVSLNDALGFSWCLYAQPDEVENVHDTTALNALLRSRETGRPPDLRLSMPFVADKAPDPARLTGISKTQLLNLYELAHASGAVQTGEAGGCNDAFLTFP